MKPVPSTEIEAFRRDPMQYRALKVILDGLNGTRQALELGTYVDAPQYGRWGSVFVGANAMHDGASAPTWATFDGWGKFPSLAAGKSMIGSLLIPEAYRAGEPLRPTIHFSFDSAPAAGDTFQWGLRSTVSSSMSIVPASVLVSATHAATASDLKRQCSLRLPTPAVAAGPGALVLFEAVLTATSSAVAAFFLGVSWAYQKRDFGTGIEP